MIEKLRITTLLQLDRAKFYRIKGGQTAREVEKTLKIPANNCFNGLIIEVVECRLHTAQPFETYALIAQKYGVDETKLQNFNGSRPIYPTCKIYIPNT